MIATWNEISPSALISTLKGAEKAILKGMPYAPPDNEAIYMGEWLNEVREAIVLLSRP